MDHCSRLIRGPGGAASGHALLVRAPGHRARDVRPSADRACSRAPGAARGRDGRRRGRRRAQAVVHADCGGRSPKRPGVTPYREDRVEGSTGKGVVTGPRWCRRRSTSVGPKKSPAAVGMLEAPGAATRLACASDPPLRKSVRRAGACPTLSMGYGPAPLITSVEQLASLCAPTATVGAADGHRVAEHIVEAAVERLESWRPSPRCRRHLRDVRRAVHDGGSVWWWRVARVLVARVHRCQVCKTHLFDENPQRGEKKSCSSRSSLAGHGVETVCHTKSSLVIDPWNDRLFFPGLRETDLRDGSLSFRQIESADRRFPPRSPAGGARRQCCPDVSHAMARGPVPASGALRPRARRAARCRRGRLPPPAPPRRTPARDSRWAQRSRRAGCQPVVTSKDASGRVRCDAILATRGRRRGGDAEPSWSGPPPAASSPAPAPRSARRRRWSSWRATPSCYRRRPSCSRSSLVGAQRIAQRAARGRRRRRYTAPLKALVTEKFFQLVKEFADGARQRRAEAERERGARAHHLLHGGGAGQRRAEPERQRDVDALPGRRGRVPLRTATAGGRGDCPWSSSQTRSSSCPCGWDAEKFDSNSRTPPYGPRRRHRRLRTRTSPCPCRPNRQRCAPRVRGGAPGGAKNAGVHHQLPAEQRDETCGRICAARCR